MLCGPASMPLALSRVRSWTPEASYTASETRPAWASVNLMGSGRPATGESDPKLEGAVCAHAEPNPHVRPLAASSNHCK